MSEIFVTPEARLTHNDLWAPRSFQNNAANPAKFQAVLVLTVSDPQVTQLVENYNQYIFDTYGVNDLPYGKKGCILEGKVRYPADPFYADKLILSTSRFADDGAPEIKLDPETPVIDKTDIYAGCVVRGLVNFWSYKGGTGGIGCKLHSLMKIRDDEPISTGEVVDTAAAFAGYTGAGPSSAAPAAPAGFGLPPSGPKYQF